jgi:SAM-dependent methyltransferase
MLNWLRLALNEANFKPSFLSLLVNPFHFARKGLYENIADLSIHIHGQILDVGCGQKPYERLFNVSKYIGLELDTDDNRANKKADYYYDGKHFPFADREFDAVVINQVLEHVFESCIFLSEVNRILKDNGLLLLTVPFVWDEHEQPSDFARYSSFGLKYILENKGFEILEARKTNADIRIIFQLTNAYSFKIFLGYNRYIRLLFSLIVVGPVNVVGEALYRFFPKNSDLYLDNIVLAVKKKNVG